MNAEFAKLASGGAGRNKDRISRGVMKLTQRVCVWCVRERERYIYIERDRERQRKKNMKTGCIERERRNEKYEKK
mgnify:CR=1 FL=1